MKRFSKILTAFIVIAFASTLIAGAYFQEWQARSDGSTITLEWKTAKEDNVINYVVERKTVNSPSFTEIAYVAPKGDNSYYSYIDENIFKSNGEIYVYHIKIIDNSKTTYSQDISVSHNPSSVVKRTWGMIKAMFR